MIFNTPYIKYYIQMHDEHKLLYKYTYSIWNKCITLCNLRLLTFFSEYKLLKCKR